MGKICPVGYSLHLPVLVDDSPFTHLLAVVVSSPLCSDLHFSHQTKHFNIILFSILWDFSLYQCARAAATTYHRLGGSNNKVIFSLLESKIEGLAGWVSSEAPFLDLQVATFSLCAHMVISLWMPFPAVSLHVQISSSFLFLKRHQSD